MLLKLAAALCIGFVAAFLIMSYHQPYALVILALLILIRGYRTLALVTLLSALAFMVFAKLQLQQSLPEALDKHVVLLSVHLIELPQQQRLLQAAKYTVALNQEVRLGDFTLAAGSHIRLSDYANLPIKVGEDWQLRTVLRPPRGLVNIAGFDYRRWLLSEYIVATGYIVKDEANLRLGRRSTSLLWLRQQLALRMDQALSDRPSRALIKALVMGDASGFTQEHRKVLQTTGVAHLFVISGLHIGLLAILAWWLGRGICVLLWRPMQSGYAISIQVGVAVLAALLYAALAGFSLPTIRALIMVSLVLLAGLQRRNYKPVYILVVAAALILVFDPLAILGMSFWLSFMAVLVLLYAWHSQQRVQALLLSQLSIFLVLSIVLSLFDLPVSLLAPFINLVAIPLLSLLLVPLSLLASALLLLGIEVPLEFTQWVFDGLWQVLAYISTYETTTVVLTPSLVTVVIASIGLMLGFRYKRLWFVALLAQLPLWFLPVKPHEGVVITVFDVGQGLAVLVRHQDYSLLYDTGAAFSSGFSMAGAVLEPSLYRLGVRNLDTLVISHGDNDHAGGASHIIDVFEPSNIYAPARVAALQDGYKNCPEAGVIQRGDLRLAFISAGLQSASSNNASCVLKVIYHDFSLLLTGDIGKLAEFSIGADYKIEADVLLIPHHGSKSSSSAAFLEAVSPRLAVVSTGFNNRFGHPHLEVLQRYQERNIPVFNTAIEGAINIHINPRGEITAVNRARDKKFGFWH